MSIKDYNRCIIITDATLNEVVNQIRINEEFEIDDFEYSVKCSYQDLLILKTIKELLNNQHDRSINYGYKRNLL